MLIDENVWNVIQPDVITDKPHTQFLRKVLGKKVQFIRHGLRYVPLTLDHLDLSPMNC